MSLRCWSDRVGGAQVSAIARSASLLRNDCRERQYTVHVVDIVCECEWWRSPAIWQSWAECRLEPVGRGVQRSPAEGRKRGGALAGKGSLSGGEVTQHLTCIYIVDNIHVDRL